MASRFNWAAISLPCYGHSLDHPLPKDLLLVFRVIARVHQGLFGLDGGLVFTVFGVVSSAAARKLAILWAFVS